MIKYKINNYPYTIVLNISNRCMLKCKTCQRQHREFYKAKDMNFKVVNKVLETYPKIKYFCFCGLGSTLINNDVCEFAKLIRKKVDKPIISLTTNGLLIHKYIKDLHMFDSINVSLYGFDKETYIKNTGVDCFQEVYNNLNLIFDKVKTKITLSFVIHKENIQEAINVFQKFKHFNFDKFHFHNIAPHFDLNFDNQVFTEKDIDILNDFNLAIETLNVSNSKIIYPTHLDTTNKISKCFLPFYIMSVDGDGNISICNCIYPPDPKNGNIFKDKDVWLNEQSTKFRKQQKQGNVELCKKCFWNNKE